MKISSIHLSRLLTSKIRLSSPIRRIFTFSPKQRLRPNLLKQKLFYHLYISGQIYALAVTLFLASTRAEQPKASKSVILMISKSLKKNTLISLRHRLLCKTPSPIALSRLESFLKRPMMSFSNSTKSRSQITQPTVSSTNAALASLLMTIPTKSPSTIL